MSANEKKSAGRPVGSGFGRTETMEVKLTVAEKRSIQSKAKSCGLPMSAWVRMVLNEAARSPSPPLTR